MGIRVNPDGSITVGIIPEEAEVKKAPASLPTEKDETVVSEVKKRGRKPKQA